MASTDPRPRQNAQEPECEVLAACLSFLRLKGARPVRRNVGAFLNASGQYVQFGTPGEADIQAIWHGRLIAVECKHTGYRPHGQRAKWHFAAQIAWLNQVNASGGVGVMVDRVEWLVRLWLAIEEGARFHVADDGTVEVWIGAIEQ